MHRDQSPRPSSAKPARSQAATTAARGLAWSGTSWMVVWLLAAGGFAPTVAAQSLHDRIDRLILAAAASEPLAPLADDAEFARRLYLDLAGRIPSYAELRQFLDSSQDNKRELLIDQLLSSADHPRRMQELFTAMLLERRGDDAQWAEFLRASFEANKPWDQLAREIVSPDPQCEATRGAAFFHTKRLEKVGQQEIDYPGLTRDVGRLFLGMDLQCAQCHDHLFIDSYKQQDFQGLFIAFQSTFIRTDLRFPAIGVRPITDKLEFMSVFDQVPRSTGPRLPGGDEVEIPRLAEGEQYLEPPDRKNNFPGTPKFSALAVLAQEMTTAENRAFVDNITNRLWFVLMGRGLVHPLDQHHIGNPPSHPEVLELLGQEFVARRFDIRWLLRELALSETYQRSSRLPPDLQSAAPQAYLTANERHLSAEQLFASVLVATGRRQWQWPDALGASSRAADASGPGSETENAAAPPDGPDLKPLRDAFIKAFANPPQDPEVQFNPSLQAALFIMNDDAVLELLVPRNGNLAERLAATADPLELAVELYACVLTRAPSEEELTAVADYLQLNPERREAAISNLIWALLASTEFCINH